MAAWLSRVVAQKIPGPDLLQIIYADAVTEAVGFDRAPFAIALALDIPKLQRVEEIAETDRGRLIVRPFS